jgi:Family of unknown function (DUF6000)
MPTPTDPIHLHSAGATARHKSPFSDLAVPSSVQPLSREFVARWVSPFYMSFLGLNFLKAEFESAFDRVSATIDQQVIETLLSEFDWRPRIVGGYFAAIKNIYGAERLLGTLLLRSDVCYAATGYCLALARFNSESARIYLTDYLDYYLAGKDLEFDQGTVMGALAYMDRVNSRNDFDRFMPKWHEFIGNESGWNPDWVIEKFSERMRRVLELADKCS